MLERGAEDLGSAAAHQHLAAMKLRHSARRADPHDADAHSGAHRKWGLRQELAPVELTHMDEAARQLAEGLARCRPRDVSLGSEGPEEHLPRIDRVEDGLAG